MVCAAIVVLLALQPAAALGELASLEPMEWAVQSRVLLAMAGDFLLCYLLDRTVSRVFPLPRSSPPVSSS